MRWATELLDLILPRSCAGCGSPGALVCQACDRELHLGLATPCEPVDPGSSPRDLPPVWAQGSYAGVLADVIRRHKDEDRRDLGPWCARYLRGAIAECLLEDPVVARAACNDELLLTTVPSSARAKRSRGRDPLWDILITACAADFGTMFPARRLLQVSRPTRDQVGLGAAARARNLAGAMVVAPGERARVTGNVVMVVDDIVTTGSTLVEASRALHAAGASHVAAATIAATPRADYGRVMKGSQDPRGHVRQADSLSATGLPFPTAPHLLHGGERRP